MQFSIIIPVYNAEKSLKRCLDSIVRQTFKDFEIILVDDGSRDSSLKLIDVFMQENSSLRTVLIKQPNSGAGKARNNGISKANGKYIVFLDSDDYVDSVYLEKVNYSIESENADVVFIDIVRETELGYLIRKESMSQFRSLDKDSMIRAQLTGKMPWGGVRKIAKTSIIKDNQLEYAPIKVGEESIFSFRLLELAERISFQPEAIYHYVETDTSLTAHDDISNSERVFNYMYGYLKEHNKLEKYRTTVRAMAVTTVAVGLNLISRSRFSVKTWHQMKDLISKYRPYFDGEVDKKSLDKRVRMCYPWIKIGFPLPILLMSKFQAVVKRIKV